MNIGKTWDEPSGKTGSGKKFALSATSERERRAWKQVLGAAKFLPRLQEGCKMIKHGVVKSREVFFSLSPDATRLCYHDFQGRAGPGARGAGDRPSFTRTVRACSQ